MFIPIPTFSFVEVPYLEFFLIYIFVAIVMTICFIKLENSHKKKKDEEKIISFDTVAYILLFPILVLAIIFGD